MRTWPRLQIVALLLIPTGPLAAQSVTLPPEIKAAPGQWVKIEPVKVDGGRVSWRLDPLLAEADLGKLLPADVIEKLKVAGLDPAKVFPADALKNGRGKVIDVKPGLPTGRYRVEAWTAKGDVASDIATSWIVVGDPTPPNPPPAPGPLAAALQKCFDADPGTPAAKAAQRLALNGLYQAMIDHAKLPAIQTTGELLGDLRTVAGTMIAPNSLIECRKLIAAEIVAALGTNDSARLDPELRPRALDVFDRIAKALAEVR